METPSMYHAPVMPEECASFLVTRKDGTYADGTLGGGGHASFLLERFPELKIIGFDWDEAAQASAGERLRPYGTRARLFRENFRDMKRTLAGENLLPVDGVFLDLGVSSRQLDDRDRGFSFASPLLDMRMDRRTGTNAADIINTWDAESLADLFYRYGDEYRSRPIARAVVQERSRKPFSTGEDLARVVEKVKPRRGKIHPATQVFQALRIAVNRELENLEQILADLPDILSPGGRAVIISYHSLEDRLVKNRFREYAAAGTVRVLTKKIVTPSLEEQKNNPRARSAKLRAAERVS